MHVSLRFYTADTFVRYPGHIILSTGQLFCVELPIINMTLDTGASSTNLKTWFDLQDTERMHEVKVWHMVYSLIQITFLSVAVTHVSISVSASLSLH